MNEKVINPGLLKLKDKVLADPQRGEAILEGFATGCVILSWEEVELVEEWIEAAQRGKVEGQITTIVSR